MPPLILQRVEAVANPGITTGTSTYKLPGSIQYIYTHNVSILIHLCKFYYPHTSLQCFLVFCLFVFLLRLSLCKKKKKNFITIFIDKK